MKKKGFTLIELLAVIVILAIIALIATPIVMNVIENSKKGAAERSAENYLRAVDLAIASERLEGPVTDGEYKTQEDGSLCIVENGIVDCSKSKLNVEVNGDKPINGTILIQDGQIVDKLTETKPTGEQEEKFTIITTKENYKVSYNAEGKLEAVKNEDNEGSSEEPENTSITVYRWSTETINLNQEIDPTDTTKFTTDSTTLGKIYYLKHVVENNIVTESYACIVFDGEEACVRGGSADYYGYAEDPANYTGNALILNGLQDKVKGIYCGVYESDSMCNVSSKEIWAMPSGFATVYNGNDYCEVSGEGSSYCKSA